MTPPEFVVPAHVEANVAARAVADTERERRRQLSAELRRLRGTPDPPVPDPSRNAKALREKAAAKREETDRG